MKSKLIKNFIIDIFMYVLKTFLNVMSAGNHWDAVGYGEREKVFSSQCRKWESDLAI